MNDSTPLQPLHTTHRRQFIKMTGAAGLGLAFHLPQRLMAGPLEEGADTDGAFSPNAFIRVNKDGSVVLTVAKSEMGQGVRTALPMILAEELEADWGTVRIEQASTDPKYGRLRTTGGSSSVRTSWLPLRQAAATARYMLIAAAAQEWKVEPAQCHAEKGRVHGPQAKSLSFAELTSKAAALDVPDPKSLVLKDAADFKIVGTSVGRIDNPEIVTGRARYGIDVRRPGMLFASVERCPVEGGRLLEFDAQAAKALNGVVEVVAVGPVGRPVNVRPGVAVLARSTWAALQGRRALKIKWDEGPHASENSADLRRQMAELADKPGREIHKIGDVDSALKDADEVFEAVYELPYQSHTPMEPMNATAEWSAEGCRVWAPTQTPDWARTSIARALDLKPDAVRVDVTLLGGGFGRRLNPDVPVEAALLSKAVQRPVQVLWSREDETRHDFYRPASLHRLAVGLDSKGKPLAWRHRLITPAIQVSLAGPEAPNLERSEVGGAHHLPYRLPHFRLEYALAQSGLHRGWWRSVEHSFNAFAIQSFIDELAHKSGVDPLKYHLDLLGADQEIEGTQRNGYALDSGRYRKVLQMAADKAGWKKDPGKGKARGLAAHYSFFTYSAQVAEVSLDDEGQVRVDRVVCAIDCGTVINPDIASAQAEGSIAFALSAMRHAITVEKGRVRQSNFHDYPILRMPAMPRVEVHFVSSRDKPAGMGEPNLPPLAPAVANAIFALTGKRVRKLPLDI